MTVGHRIAEVEIWRPYGTLDEVMFLITFAYKGEQHEMLCGWHEEHHEATVSHNEQLDATSDMDEMVMERMAKTFVEVNHNIVEE